MNSSTTIGISLAELLGMLVAAGVFIAYCVVMAFKFQGKFAIERTLTTTEIDKLRVELHGKTEKNEQAIRKVADDVIDLRDLFRTELDKKVDTITAGLDGIKTLVNQLSQNIAAKYVERSEIDSKHARLEERVSNTEQGVSKMVSQNDQMLALLAQIRLDANRKQAP